MTVAVLPFENLSGDEGREYLADGLAEETIASFGQIDPEHLSVIGRTSTLAYKRTRKSLAEIGRELGAAFCEVTAGHHRPDARHLYESLGYDASVTAYLRKKL